MTFEEIIQTVANELNLPYDVCYRAYMSSWKFILEKAQELPLSENMPLEEFKKLRVNFNMPSLGKLYITDEAFQKKSKKLRIIKELKERKDVQGKED